MWVTSRSITLGNNSEDEKINTTAAMMNFIPELRQTKRTEGESRKLQTKQLRYQMETREMKVQNK